MFEAKVPAWQERFGWFWFNYKEIYRFTDEQLESARRALIQRHTSAKDNPDSLESFYIGQTLYDTYATPDEKRSRVLAVTREDVCRAARLTHFDTTYLLAPNEEVE